MVMAKRDSTLLVRCWLVLLSVFLFTGELQAQTTGRVQVIFQGETTAGITVQLSGEPITTALEKRTGRSSSVGFKNLTAGTYTVTPSKNGLVFTPPYAQVTVVASRTTRVRIRTKAQPRQVGMSYCTGCHTKVTTDVYADWLKGPHGNFNYVNQAHQEFGYTDFTDSMTYPADYTLFTGFPNDASITQSLTDPENAGMKAADCLRCHGPRSADNSKVATFPLIRPDGTLDTINSSTQIARPVIGCEMCHGGGSKHIASPRREMPFNEPSAAQCGQCHNNKIPQGHLTYHPAILAGPDSPGIYEAYQSSAHGDSIDDSSLYTDAQKTKMQALCAKCHSDHGARIYRDKSGDATTLPALFTGEADHTKFAPVQCRTCHDAHDPSKLLKLASAATGSATARSAQFNTCTNCHQLLTASDGVITPYHSDHAASITNTHYDNPATDAIEGYNVNRGSDSACLDCHNPHSANTTINKQWAESGHGDLAGLAWEEQDFKSGSNACKRCHTATGFIARLSNPDAWDAGNVTMNFSYLSSKQKEVLYCNACHTNSAFDRRTISPVKFPSGLSVSLSDDSNLCMACHQGRAAKVTIDTKVAGAAPYSFTNIHYYAAAATFFGTDTKGGYEYSGKTYVGQNLFAGHEGKLDTCVKCHLREGQPEYPDHHMKPVVADCGSSECHSGITTVADIRPTNVPDYDGDGNSSEGLNGEMAGLQARLYAAIRAYAQSAVVPTYSGWYISYDAVGASGQYFFKDPNNNGVKDAGETTAYNKFNARLLKAAYNYQVAQKEPHGYIHNYKYIFALLYDSIEDLGASTSGLVRP